MASVPVLTALKGLTLRLGDLNQGPQHFDIELWMKKRSRSGGGGLRARRT